MSSLPDDMRYLIFEMLPLDDLLTCRLVDRSFKQSAENILANIKHIEFRDKYTINEDNFCDGDPADRIHHLEGRLPRLSVSLIDDNFTGLLRFIDKFCPRVISLGLPRLASASVIHTHFPNLKYLSAEACISRFNFKMEDFVAQFPRLRALYLWTPPQPKFDPPYRRNEQREKRYIVDMCWNELRKMYCAKSPDQLVQFTLGCHRQHTPDCFLLPKNLPKSIEAINHGLKSALDLRSLDLQVRNRLKLLEVNEIQFEDISSVTLPELRHIDVHEPCDLESVACMLTRSPKLRQLRLVGNLNQGNSYAVESLASSCPLLTHFLLMRDERKGYLSEGHLTIRIGPNLEKLSLSCEMPVSLNAPLQHKLRFLHLRARNLISIDFNLPNLIHLSIDLRCKGEEEIAWIMECVKNSKRLREFCVGFIPPSGFSNSRMKEITELMTTSQSLDYIELGGHTFSFIPPTVYAPMPVQLNAPSSSHVRVLRIAMKLPPEFEFRLPNLVHFELTYSNKKLDMSRIIESLCHSPALELIDMNLMVEGGMDMRTIKQISSLFTFTKFLTFASFSCCHHVPPGIESPDEYFIDLSSLNYLFRFRWRVIGYQFSAKIPPHFEQTESGGFRIKEILPPERRTYTLRCFLQQSGDMVSLRRAFISFHFRTMKPTPPHLSQIAGPGWLG